jgi:hypothetical protein
MRCDAVFWRSIIAGAVLGGFGFLSVPARSADLPVKAPAVTGCVQAVDGLNGKVAAFGG